IRGSYGTLGTTLPRRSRRAAHRQGVSARRCPVPEVPMSHSEDQRGPHADVGPQAEGELPTEVQLEQARSEAGAHRRKSEAYLDLAQRAQADFMNYKRRTTQELEQKIRDANSGLLTQLLPVVDDLKRALASVPPELTDQPWPQGVALIGQKLEQILQR